MTQRKNQSKRKHAVALRYAEEDRAPKIIATGAGELARRILELAQEYGVPVHNDDSLVGILSRLDLGYEIPPETYRAVAEVLAFLYRTDIAWRKRKEEQSQRFKAFGRTKSLKAGQEQLE
jgi:flagellar biosynthesis protein